MTKQTLTRDKINNAIAFLSEIAKTNEVFNIDDYKARHTARYNNFVELSKLFSLQRIHGSIDDLVSEHCNAVTMEIQADSSRYCEKHGIKQIDDLEKFFEWLAKEDVAIDEKIAIENARK